MEGMRRNRRRRRRKSFILILHFLTLFCTSERVCLLYSSPKLPLTSLLYLTAADWWTDGWEDGWGPDGKQQKSELMRQIALFAAVRGITGRLPILILFSSNFALSVSVVVNWRGAVGRGGAWGRCECPCFDRGEIEGSASALCQGKMTAAQNTDLWMDRVSDWCLQSDSCFEGCAWPKYTQHETEYLISHMRSSSFIELILCDKLWQTGSTDSTHRNSKSHHAFEKVFVFLQIVCSTKMVAFELKRERFVFREVVGSLMSEGWAKNKEKHRTSNPLFCTHKITNSEKVWRNYSDCRGICNYYKSSQPTKAMLSTLHEVHWKLWEQKWNHVWAHSLLAVSAQCVLL